MDENELKCIQDENIVGWTRKCWMKSLIESKLHPTSSNMIFFFFLFFLKFWKLSNASNISSSIENFRCLDAFAPALIKVIFHAIFCLISKLVTLGKKIFDSALASLNITYQVEEDPYNKVWHRSNFLTWPQIMEPYSKWI